MPQLLIPVFIAALVVGFAAGAIIRKRRRRADPTPELQKHPERLDQMLDPTDDA